MCPLSLNKKIKVLVVDDSAVVRKILARELNTKEGIEVVGTAADPYIAREKIVALKPDVISLDIEMPRMDGITFLKKLMAAKPMPVIVLSSLGEEGGPVALEALASGAVEVVRKPGEAYTVQETCDQMATLIRVAYNSFSAGKRPAPASQLSIGIKKKTAALAKTTNKIVAIGSSTGGVQALSEIFTALPANSPGIIVVQHMPPKFTSLFAQRLNNTCAVRVKEAEAGDRVIPGQILIAPGGFHMTLTRSGAVYQVQLNTDPPVQQQRPSADVLFESVAHYAGSNAVGIILTGMGADGAAGLKSMQEAGAKTIAQDEASCVVFGMPGSAIKLGAADQIIPLNKIADKLLHAASH